MPIGALSSSESRVARSHSRLVIPLALAAWLALIVGCKRESGPKAHAPREVVVYCSVDAQFAEPLLAAFATRARMTIHPVFDTEAGKTTGLVNRLYAERDRPRADVWWSSEVFGTMQLARQGLLSAYKPAGTEDIPARYRDPGDLWTGVGLRGRVLAYDPRRIRKEEVPTRWRDLADRRFAGRIAMADPRFGTTRGHMATLLSLWGRDTLSQFYRGLRENGCRLTDGNSQSVLLVTRGTVDLAATDTDDVIAAQQRGESVALVYPDLGLAGGAPKGSLWIPCSVGWVKGAVHAEAAKELIDYLVSAEIEESLFRSDSHNVPVRPALRSKLGAGATGEATVEFGPAATALEPSDDLAGEWLLKDSRADGSRHRT